MGYVRRVKVCWLVGMAGARKSAISHTFRETPDDSIQLGASFFCAHASIKANEARLIIPTIAYALWPSGRLSNQSSL
jgi:hypothetical protein